MHILCFINSPDVILFRSLLVAKYETLLVRLHLYFLSFSWIHSHSINYDYMSLLEKYIVLRYDRTCTETMFNYARYMCSLLKVYQCTVQHSTNWSNHNAAYTCGDRRWSVLKFFQHKTLMVGERVQHKAGNHSGEFC